MPPYILRLWRDPFNDRGEFRMLETYVDNVRAAQLVAGDYERAVLLDPHADSSSRIVWSKGF